MAATSSAAAPDSPVVQNSSCDIFQQWLNEYGSAEYALYKEDTATPPLSYEDWASSQYALGPYLYRMTLDAWDAVSSSDDDDDDDVVDAPSAQPAAPIQAAKAKGKAKAKTKVTLINGTGATSNHSSAGHAASNGVADQPVHSAKKRRKRRKNNQSQPILLSQDDGQPSTPHAAVQDGDGAGTSTKKRKPGRKPKSATTPGLHAAEVMDVSESAPGPDTSTKSSTAQGATASTASAASTPLAPGESSPSSAARRGLRTRTPAQQRPYFHNAKLFEEIEDASTSKPSSTTKSKLGAVSYADEEEEEEEEMPDADESDIEMAPPPVAPASTRTTPRKFKGKGRAWKKDSNEDEDGEYRAASSVTKQLQQQAPVQPAPKKKRGRPRKSQPTDDAALATPQKGAPDVFSLYSAADLRTASDQDSLAHPAAPGDEQTKQRQRRPRRPHLSEEFVRDDDSESDLGDDNEEEEEEETDNARPNPDDRGPNLTGKPRLVVTLKTCLRPPVPAPQFPRPKQQRRPRMRKSFLSQEFVGDDSSDLDDAEGPPKLNGDDVQVEQRTPMKQRRRSRKSHLSEEFVRDDDTEDDFEASADAGLPNTTSTPGVGVDKDGDVQMANGDDDDDDGGENMASPVQSFTTPKRRSTASTWTTINKRTPTQTNGNGDTHGGSGIQADEKEKAKDTQALPLPRKGYTASGKKIGRPPKNRQASIIATNTTPSGKGGELAAGSPNPNPPTTSATTTPTRRGRLPKKRVSIADAGNV